MTTWHASDLDLAEYLDGTITHVHAASVEAHLLGCADCRRRLSETRSAASGADRMWARIADEVDRPSRRLGHTDGIWARALFGSPALAAATLAAVAGVLALPMAVELFSVRVAVTILMAIAPVAPALGVVAAFRPSTEPSGEMGRVAPLGSTRLLLARALVVAVGALPAGLLATLLLPLPASKLLVWVVPGLAFTAVSLALATHGDPTRPALALAVAWAAVVGLLAVDLREVPVARALTDWPASNPAFQLTLAVVAVIAAVDAGVRRDALAPWSAA